MIAIKKHWLYIAAIIAALLQTGVMLAGVQQRMSILRNGSEVVLRTVPIDPRDLMRGEYVILNYDISRLPVALVQGEPPHKSGLNYIYVVMAKQKNDMWEPQRAQFEPANDLKDDEIMLRGEMEAPMQRYNGSTMPVTYGIERYYVPEGEGRVLETAQIASKVDIVLSVNSKGVAAIRAIKVDGQTMYKEPLF